MEGDLGVVWRNSLLPVNDLEGLEFLIQCRQRCASAPSELNSCGSHVRVWDLVSCPAAAPIREGTSGTSGRTNTGRDVWYFGPTRHYRLCNFRNWAPKVRLALMLWPDSVSAQSDSVSAQSESHCAAIE